MGKHQKPSLRLAASADDQYGVLADVGVTRIAGLGVQVHWGGWHDDQAAAAAALPALQAWFPGATCWLVSKGTPQSKEDVNAYGVLLQEDDCFAYDGWFSAPAMAQARLAVLQQQHPDCRFWLMRKSMPAKTCWPAPRPVTQGEEKNEAQVTHGWGQVHSYLEHG